MGRPPRYSSEKMLRRKPSGIWEAVWRDPLTGETKRESTKKRSEREAQLVLIAMKTVSDHPTIADLIDRYTARQEKSGKKIAPIRASLRPVSTFMGTLTADAVTQDHIDDYVLWRREQKRWEGDIRFKRGDHGTISDSTISKDLRMLRACLNDAAARRYIESALQFRIPVSEAPPKDDWLTKDEVERLLAACDEGSAREHLAGFILIAITTGARKSAILELSWDGVFLGGALAPTGWGDLLGKTGETAYIDFGAANGNKRRPRIQISHNQRLMAWLQFVANRTAPRVITYKGEPVKDIKKSFKSALKEAGIKRKLSPHVLKHTAITWMMRAGVPIAHISDWVNTSERVLLKHYGHHRPDFSEELRGIFAD